MPKDPISLDWPGKRAVLLVHGIGNATPGEYAPLAASLRTLLDTDADSIALYELYYDEYNDWISDKMQLGGAINALKSTLKTNYGGDDIADTISEFAGDIIWPVLHLAGRAIVREVYLAQLKQIVRDGLRSGVGAWNQQITIICHSMGCFHTFEALHAAASNPAHALQPLSNGVTFANVIFMASPVQLIRHVASRIRPLIPKPDELATLRGQSLAAPGQTSVTGYMERAVKRWVAISGELDPVSGYLFRHRLTDAWMDVDGQESIIDNQSLLGITSRADLKARLIAAIRANKPPDVTLQNPHSWQGYVDRHSNELRQWLSA